MKKVKFSSFILIILLCLTFGGYYLYSVNVVKQFANKIYPKVYINDMDVSGKTEDEAKKIIEAGTSYLQNKKIIINYKDKVYYMNYAQINPSFNTEDALKEAFDYGKSLDVFESLKLIRRPVEKRCVMKFDYDETAIDSFLEELGRKVAIEVQDASIEMASSGKFKINEEIIGEKLRVEDMKNKIISKINDYIDNREIEAVTEVVNPTITKELLGKINTLISSFSTSYNTSNINRARNLELATKAINGTVVFPGQTFSFNERTGKRTAEKGYLAAPVIIKNKLEDGLGGGVCQVSSTLYNAIIRTNIRSVERKNHSLAPAYLAPGYDATVSDNIDYKFKNTLDFPIYIEGYTKNSKVIFNIYSNSSLKDTEYYLSNDIYEEIPAETQIIEDSSLTKGNTKEEPSHIGYKVKVYLIAKKAGEEIWKEEISRDIYKKVDGVLRIGIGG